MKHHSLSKVLKRLACVLAALVIALAVAVFALWHNELATLSSLKKLSDRDEAHRDGAVYQLNVSGGYYFDDFLAQGGRKNTLGSILIDCHTVTIICGQNPAELFLLLDWPIGTDFHQFSHVSLKVFVFLQRSVQSR